MSELHRLLDWLFRKSDPSFTWVADPSAKMEVNLDEHSLCGVRIGDAVGGIAKLGPPENLRPHTHGQFVYGDRGFVLDTEDGRVVGFIVTFDDHDGVAATGPFSGDVCFGQRRVNVPKSMPRNAWQEIFGEPYWCDEDEDEYILFYEFDRIEWQVEISKAEGVRCIIVQTPPLFEDPKQRQSYGMDKPWPPR